MERGAAELGLSLLVRALARLQVQISLSQEGEDRILQRLFEGKRGGRYIDVGALHPVRFSNTALLYLQGWSGINVDATPGSMAPFRRLRRRDVNLEVAIGSEAGERTFHTFTEPALNTFDPDLARVRRDDGWSAGPDVSVWQRTLSDVWDAHVPVGQEVDLLTVDIEGGDLDALNSLDWERQRPRVVCFEELTGSRAIEELLRSRGYEPVGRTVHSHLYRRI